jgi:hypothetical protein
VRLGGMGVSYSVDQQLDSQMVEKSAN